MADNPAATRTGTVRGITSMATRHLLEELVAVYRQRSAEHVELTSTGGVDAFRRVEAGEAFDFVVLAAEAIDALVDAGRIEAASVLSVARSGVAIAVPAASGTVDVATEDAVRRAILAARRIGYSTGPSGTHLVRLFETWGIAAEVAPRLVQAPPGVPVATLVANGQVDLGFQQASELVHAPGIDIAGPLPDPIQRMTLFSAGACPGCASATGTLLALLASPDADAAKRRHGLDPVPVVTRR